MVPNPPYKMPLAELGLENRVAMALAQREKGVDVTPFFPGSEGKVFLVHSPPLIRDVLGKQSDIFVEEKHPYNLVETTYSPAGREVLLLDKTKAQEEIGRDQRWKAIEEIGKRHMARFREGADSGVTIDAFPLFSHMVLDVMGKILFDFDMGELSERFFRVSMQHEDFLAVSKRGRPGTSEFEAQKVRVREALLEQEKIALEILESRRQSGAAVPSVLPRGIPPARALVRTMLNAYAGTATTLSWVAVLLAGEQDWQERLAREAVSVRSSLGPDQQPLSNLVIRETLRLYPTAWMMSRLALKDTQLGGTKIPERSMVFICTYTLHRDPKYWKNAETFLPQRFLEGEFGGAIPYSYLPFGAGSHRCPGMRFAMDTIRILLATFLQEFQIAPGDQEIEAFPRVALQPEPGALIRVSHRRQP